MGLLDLLLELGNENNKSEDSLFEDEADTFGLTKEEKEECKQIGISPEEWAMENDEEYHKDFGE